MIKKIITIFFLLILTGLSTSVSFAQRGIDPSLKPQNAPDIPLTGPAFLECVQKNDKSLYETISKEITGKTDAEKEAIYKKYNDKTKKYWDANTQICRGNEEEPINAFIQILAGALLMISGGLAVIVMAVGGIMYVTSRGNQQQLEFAKHTITYGVIGMVVIIFSYFIVKFIIQLIIGI